MHMDAQQLIGGGGGGGGAWGVNGPGDVGHTLGMWPWLGSCSLGAQQQTISLNFSVQGEKKNRDKTPARKYKRRRAGGGGGVVICAFSIAVSELVFSYFWGGCEEIIP